MRTPPRAPAALWLSSKNMAAVSAREGGTTSQNRHHTVGRPPFPAPDRTEHRHLRASAGVAQARAPEIILPRMLRSC